MHLTKDVVFSRVLNCHRLTNSVVIQVYIICVYWVQLTTDQAEINAEWFASSVKAVTNELSQLTTSLDAGDKAVDSARVSTGLVHVSV